MASEEFKALKLALEFQTQALIDAVAIMREQVHTDKDDKKTDKKETLYGKVFETFRKFKGGEEEWVEWSEDFKMTVDMKAEKLGMMMRHVEVHGEMSWEAAAEEMAETHKDKLMTFDDLGKVA